MKTAVAGIAFLPVRLAQAVVLCCAPIMAGVLSGLGPANALAQDGGTLELASLREVDSSIVSCDCEGLMLWYASASNVVAHGGHSIEAAKAEAIFRQMAESWTARASEEELNQLSDEMGVPSVLLKMMWSRFRIIWESKKVKNTIESRAGERLNCSFDGTADWQSIKSSHQVTAYEQPAKWGYFRLDALRRRFTLQEAMGMDAEDDSMWRFSVSRAGGTRMEYVVDKRTGCVSHGRITNGNTVFAHYESGHEILDKSSTIKFPKFSANVAFVEGKLFKAELFFTQQCSLNHPIDDQEFAVPAESGTNVWYSGDLLPQEEAAAHARNELVVIRLNEPTKDVRTLLPELRRTFEARAQSLGVKPGVAPQRAR